MNQMNFFITYLWKDPMFFLAAIIIVVFSVCAHEFMHAWIALLQGDGTAAERGHLTMSPLKQMGPWSLFMLAFIGIAWGQVPVDPSRMRHRYSHALVAFAGPATNLLLGAAFSLLCFLAFRNEVGTEFTWDMLYFGATINMVLFLLNLLPVPGFDGWAILVTFFQKIMRIDSEIVKGSFFVIIILVFMGIGKLFEFGRISTAAMLWFFQTVAQWIAGA